MCECCHDFFFCSLYHNLSSCYVFQSCFVFFCCAYFYFPFSLFIFVLHCFVCLLLVFLFCSTSISVYYNLSRRYVFQSCFVCVFFFFCSYFPSIYPYFRVALFPTCVLTFFSFFLFSISISYPYTTFLLLFFYFLFIFLFPSRKYFCMTFLCINLC